jgi:hypothetical protein
MAPMIIECGDGVDDDGVEVLCSWKKESGTRVGKGASYISKARDSLTR